MKTNSLLLGLENTSVGKACDYLDKFVVPKYNLNDRAIVVEKCLTLFGVLRLRSSELPFSRVPKDVIIMLTRIFYKQEISAIEASKLKKFKSMIPPPSPPQRSYYGVLTLH